VDGESAEEEEASTRPTSVTITTNQKQKRGDLQERNPSHILHKRTDQTPMPKPILQDRKPNIPRSRKHRGARDPNLKRVQIVPVDLKRQPQDHIIQQRQRRRSRNPIYRRVSALNKKRWDRHAQYENIYAIILIL
jgi:hypothetical protein